MVTLMQDTFARAVSSVIDAAPLNAINDLFKDLWFVEDYICTYDGRISLKHDIDVGISGGVPARVFYSWLSACHGKEVLLKREGAKINFKCGRARLTLPYHDIEGMMFDWSDIDYEAAVWDDESVAEAASFCSPAMSDILARLEYSGIMFTPDDSGATIAYATDDHVARMAKIKHWKGKSRQMPYRFAELSSHAACTGVAPSGMHLAQLKSGALLAALPLNAQHKGVWVAKIFEGDGGTFKVPERLYDMAVRVASLHKGVEEDQRQMTLAGKNGKLYLSTSTTIGAAIESVKCDVPDFEVVVDSSTLVTALVERPKQISLMRSKRLRALVFHCPRGSIIISTIAE